MELVLCVLHAQPPPQLVILSFASRTSLQVKPGTWHNIVKYKIHTATQLSSSLAAESEGSTPLLSIPATGPDPDPIQYICATRGFPIKILYAFLALPIRATYPLHDDLEVTNLGDLHKWLSSFVSSGYTPDHVSGAVWWLTHLLHMRPQVRISVRRQVKLTFFVTILRYTFAQELKLDTTTSLTFAT